MNGESYLVSTPYSCPGPLLYMDKIGRGVEMKADWSSFVLDEVAYFNLREQFVERKIA